MLKRLEILKAQVARRAELKAGIEEQEARLEKLDKELFALKIDAHNQQADVDTLNMFSLKNMFYDLTGKKEAMLEKETAEARTAKERYNTAVFQIEQLKRQLESDQNELVSLQGCEEEYWNLLQETLPVVHGDDREWVLCAIMERLYTIISELELSFSVGSSAYQLIDSLQENIENVRDWNRNLSGTAWSMTMQGYLNGTQKKIEDFRKQLRIFRRKLDDLPLPSQLLESADEILVFPEQYLQEIASKLTAEDRLCEADTAVRAADRRLKNVLFQLEQITIQKKQEKESVK